LRPKVLFIINSLAGGGAERVMTTLLCNSSAWRDRYDISIALLDNEPAAYALPDWITVHQLNGRGSLWPSIRQLRQLTAALKPDITLSFLTRANVANWASRIGKRGPWLISERVNPDAHLEKGLAGRIGRLLIRLCYPQATGVIAVSQGVADELSGKFAVPVERIVVVANPVDTDGIQRQATIRCPLSIDGPYVAAMGRLVENKNFSLLIDAFAKSAVAGKLVIIGDGPLRLALEDRVAAYGLQDRVILTGFLENPFSLLSGAQIFVLPSNAEGFPNGLVEAMSVRKPVISTDCKSGPFEILGGPQGSTITDMTLASFGILVPCNDIDAMAAALQYLQDKSAREAYANLAFERTKCYTPAMAAQRYWQVIEAAL
jgi:glycosyltransferase involved in cell wall biosynthesis